MFSPQNDDERLMLRAFLAATVGPLRRPHGKVSQVFLPAGFAVRVLVDNSIGNRILHVTLAGVTPGAQATSISRDGSGGSPLSLNLGTANFVLMPGESLFGATNPALVVDVYSTPF